MIEMINTILSATGTANHMPIIPYNLGSIKSPAVTNPKVLSKDNIADILLFDNAVNIAQAKIFNTQNKKIYANTEKPFFAKL